LAAIYGPNSTNRQFFHQLERAINQLRGNDDLPIIMGGDWNTTWDRNMVNENVDTFNMAAVPNPVNSQLLFNMCTNLRLTDPYRILYPNKRDFSYQPFGNVRLNRSRIDFFIVSETIIENILGSEISSSPLCTLFDHKNITLRLGCPKIKVPSKNVSNRFLDSKIFNLVINSTVHRTHLFSVDLMDPNLDATELRERTQMINEEKVKISDIRKLICEYFDQAFANARNETVYNTNMIAAILTNIEMAVSELIQLPMVEAISKSCNHSDFFCALVAETRKSAIWVKKKLFKIVREKILFLEKKIEILKANFDDNFLQIFSIEKKIEKYAILI